MGDAQKTEQPSQRRLQKAREQGSFPSSRQFIAGVQFLAFVSMLQAFGRPWLAEMATTTRWLLETAFRGELTLAKWDHLMVLLALHSGIPIVIASAVLLAVSIALQLALTKMGFSFQKLTPDFKRLSPAARLKQIARSNVPSLVQAMVLLPVSAYIVYAIVSSNRQLLHMPLESVGAANADMFHAFGTLLWRAASVFFVFGCVDLFRERRNHRSDLRMTKQELKDEHKELQGDPQIKMRVRRIQRDLARRRMMQQVPKATAVIVNPTHYAVALRYEPEWMAAPVVVAKGKNYLALRIKQIALDNQVPLVENPPLARGLYAAADIGQEIPPHLYKAVAEILAYIFRVMQRR